MDTLLTAFGGSAVALVVGYVLLRVFDENIAALFKLASERGLEEFKTDLAKRLQTWQHETETELRIRALQQPLFEEAVRVVVRLKEIVAGKFHDDYLANWNPAHLDPVSPEANKRDTAVYRLLRFFGSYHLYLASAAEAPPHPQHSTLRWYVENKIVPVFSSGGFPGSSVMWRDTIVELGEAMVSYSEKWKALRPIPWSEFCRTLSESRDPFLAEQARRVASFLRQPSIRLALLGVYLIDLHQDLTEKATFEPDRDTFLKYLYEHRSDDKGFSVYGQTIGGESDILVTNIDEGKVPRNIRSFLYAKDVEGAQQIAYDVTRDGA